MKRTGGFARMSTLTDGLRREDRSHRCRVYYPTMRV